MKNTKPQKSLKHIQRTVNLAKAFKVRTIPANIKRVILVDDIYTTGSTIDACARVLIEAGVEKVFFLSACIGRNN
jgi:predicted amidophosphoribosyltransferase